MFDHVNVHEPNSPVERKDTCSKLQNLVSKEEVNWCLFGDFNEVRKVNERLNSNSNKKDMEDFNAFIEKGGLIEIPMFGRKFTRVSDDRTMFSKLDQFLMTHKFRSLWRNLGVNVLERRWSDHTPLLLGEDWSDYGPTPFKFFDIWL